MRNKTEINEGKDIMNNLRSQWLKGYIARAHSARRIQPMVGIGWKNRGDYLHDKKYPPY